MPVVQSSGVSISSAVVLWDNYADRSTISSVGSAAGYPAANIEDPNTWNSWKPGVNPNWVRFDMGVSTSIDSVGIAAHNLGSSGVTSVEVQYSDNSTTWVSAITVTSLVDDDYLILFTASSHRYWRILSTGGIANIGYVSIGKRLVFPYAPLDDYVPLYYGRQYTKLRNESLRGQLLGNRVIAAGATTEVDLGPLSRVWVDNNVKSFKNHYDQGGTFFYASCPSKYPQDMGYCWAPEEESSMNITYTDGINNATVNFGLRSYVAQ